MLWIDPDKIGQIDENPINAPNQLNYILFLSLFLCSPLLINPLWAITIALADVLL